MLDEKTRELIAVACSVTANCHPCVRFHVSKTRQLGLTDEAIQQAAAVGQTVRKGAAGEMDKLLAELKEGKQGS
jgi:AhpD family alkylhydroperoxidase